MRVVHIWHKGFKIISLFHGACELIIKINKVSVIKVSTYHHFHEEHAFCIFMLIVLVILSNGEKKNVFYYYIFYSFIFKII